LAESVEYTSAEDFDKKLVALKENFFPSKPTPKTADAIVEDAGQPVESKTDDVLDPTMATYLRVASKYKG
jgi:hypothetical protein